MKEILISAYTCCPNRGSEPGNGWNWIIEYEKNGFAVTIITSGKYEKQIKKYLQDRPTNRLNFIYIDNHFRLFCLKLPLIGIYLHYYFWLYYSRPIFLQYINANSSIFLCHHVTYSSIKFGTPIYDLPIPTILGPLGGAAPVNKSLDRYFGKDLFFEQIKESFGELLMSLNVTVKRSIKSADILLVSNDYTQRRLDNLSLKRSISMFDAGLSDYFQMPFQIRTLDAKIEILWVGRALPRKGLNLAILAFYEFTKMYKLSDVRLTIIGNGSKIKENKQLVESLNIASKVRFLGHVEHDRLAEYYMNSHLFIFPSLKDSCPMQVFEAMAFGLPVVSLNHQGMADQIVYGTGVKVDVGPDINYPLELARAMNDILIDEDRYQTIATNAYSYGQRQRWSVRIKDFIENVVNKEL